MNSIAALALAAALIAPTATHPGGGSALALRQYALRQYADAGYPGDLGLVSVATYPTARAAADADRTNDATSTQQPGGQGPADSVPAPRGARGVRGVWTRRAMTPDQCVVVAGGARGRIAVMATDESVSGVGSPDCAAEIRWAQAHAVAALRAATG